MNITTTETELRERASEICAAHERANTIKGALVSFAEETATRLADFDAKIKAADSGSFEDTAGIQAALALKESRRRYVTQRAAEREALAVRVKRDFAAALADVDLQAFFADAHRRHLEEAAAALVPFYETEGRARAAVGNLDSVRALWSWTARLIHEAPPEIVVERLKAFVSGEKPLWKI